MNPNLFLSLPNAVVNCAETFSFVVLSLSAISR